MAQLFAPGGKQGVLKIKRRRDIEPHDVFSLSNKRHQVSFVDAPDADEKTDAHEPETKLAPLTPSEMQILQQVRGLFANSSQELYDIAFRASHQFGKQVENMTSALRNSNLLKMSNILKAGMWGVPVDFLPEPPVSFSLGTELVKMWVQVLSPIQSKAFVYALVHRLVEHPYVDPSVKRGRLVTNGEVGLVQILSFHAQGKLSWETRLETFARAIVCSSRTDVHVVSRVPTLLIAYERIKVALRNLRPDDISSYHTTPDPNVTVLDTRNTVLDLLVGARLPIPKYQVQWSLKRLNGDFVPFTWTRLSTPMTYVFGRVTDYQLTYDIKTQVYDLRVHGHLDNYGSLIDELCHPLSQKKSHWRHVSASTTKHDIRFFTSLPINASTRWVAGSHNYRSSSQSHLDQDRIHRQSSHSDWAFAMAWRHVFYERSYFARQVLCGFSQLSSDHVDAPVNSVDVLGAFAKSPLFDKNVLVLINGFL